MPDRFAEIALNLAVERTFTYRVPDELRDLVVPGRRVRVPFRQRDETGYCVALADSTDLPPARILPVSAVLDDAPLISEPMLKLTRWIADYYACAWGQALEAALPGGVRHGSGQRTESIVLPALPPDQLRAKIAELERRSPRQAHVLDALLGLDEPVPLDELARLAGCTAAPIRALAAKGLVRLDRRRVEDDPLLSLKAEREAPLVLEPAQQAALDRILALRASGKPGVVLLHGVTGSGKTEVYLQAIDRVVRDGAGAIVLVPEIALTPQTVRRFKARFDHVAVLHSHLTAGQRNEQWQLIRAGGIQVAVGARSAVFAPFPRLGLIVVDEESDPSFKQDIVPRYNARDVAVVRGRLENAVVVLGSATPALESYYNASRGRYEMAALPGRVSGRPMPRVQIVDMGKEPAALRKFRFLSRRMVDQIAARLDRLEQVIVFLNRRGFATHVSCGRCEWTLTCRRCSIAMTWHKKIARAICHYCGERAAIPATCPECHAPQVRTGGIGTERVEEEIRARFPGVECARMDSDTVRGRGSHARVLDAFLAGRVKILVGTKMIAKGLDFPNVTLVGVVNADAQLHLPDFRAGERTHQLIAQVAGRTGRGPKGGLVIVQTHQPDHYAVRTAAAHDFIAFAEAELAHRRELGMPPYSRAVRILVDGHNDAVVQRTINSLKARLDARPADPDVQVLGPMPCPIERIKDRTRWHMLLLAGKSQSLRDMISAVKPAIPKGRRVHVAIDVDPVAML